MTRLNKFLSEAGVCSRREADRLIAGGAVSVDDHIATLGEQVLGDERVLVNGKEVSGNVPPVLLLFHKPKGVVCTAEKREKDNIIAYVNYPTRIFPVGRLDKDSRGLILLTNQGDIANRILKARYHHEKEYEVVLDRAYDERFLRQMAAGVYLSELDETTRPCVVSPLVGADGVSDPRAFRIILTQGLNRQIRRMVETLGYRVVDLCRVRVMNLTLDGISEGMFREITKEEMAELLRLME